MAGVLLIGFLARAFKRVSIRSDGQGGGKLTVKAPRRERASFKVKHSKNIRSTHKVRNADVDIEDSEFTDSSTDIR